MEKELQVYEKQVESKLGELNSVTTTINKELTKLELVESGKLGGGGGGGPNLSLNLGDGGFNPLYIAAPLAAIAAGRFALQKRQEKMEEDERIEAIREKIRLEEEERLAKEKTSKKGQRLTVRKFDTSLRLLRSYVYVVSVQF